MTRTQTGHRPRRTAPASSQRGVALAVALILLIITTLIALSASRFTALEVRHSTNYETMREAEQSAQSVVEAVTSLVEVNVVTGAVGDVNCTDTPGLTGCTNKNIVLPNNMFADKPPECQIWGKAERIAPALRNLRGTGGTGSSVVEFKAASYTVTGNYDCTVVRLSRSRVEQGFLVPVQVGGQ